MIDSGAPPQEAAKCDGDHRWPRWVRNRVSIVRYRYRAYPTEGQVQALARTFGCARVVYNDCLRLRQDAHAAGEKLSDTAYRNWFDSLSGKRKGRRIGHPRFRSKRDNRQSVRLTRNGFAVRGNGRVYVAEVGDLRVEWSRPLPSVPSSCTVIREADGRYYVSFVVDRDPAPLPPTTREVGVDLGLDRLAVLSDGDVVANPRHLRKAQRRLGRAQRALARKQRGSANRGKAVHRVAVLRWRVRETRLDAHHKLALRVVRENQAVHLEVRLVAEKAEQYGRTVVKVDRRFPSSRMCSTCGHDDGPKPLAVRSWTCPRCGAEHDRDLNTARNVLAEGHRIAAGLAEIANASGAGVRPGLAPAVGDEAGTRLARLA